jgi:hypothetical protein
MPALNPCAQPRDTNPAGLTIWLKSGIRLAVAAMMNETLQYLHRPFSFPTGVAR